LQHKHREQCDNEHTHEPKTAARLGIFVLNCFGKGILIFWVVHGENYTLDSG